MVIYAQHRLARRCFFILTSDDRNHEHGYNERLDTAFNRILISVCTITSELRSACAITIISERMIWVVAKELGMTFKRELDKIF